MAKLSAIPLFALACYWPVLVSGAGGVKYALVKNEDGLSGNCRGNGGSSDLVDSRRKRLSTRAGCEQECDRLSECTGYTYSYGSEYCTLHGVAMSGHCALLDQTRKSQDECGMCSIAGKRTRSTCGSCSVKPSSGWAETENFCKSQKGAEWTPGAWSEGAWEPPGSGWTGDSQVTTHVHTVDGVAGAFCYDKYPYDGLAQCKGSAERERDSAEGLCQKDFDARQTNVGKCPMGCVYKGAIAATAEEPRKPPSCTGRADLECAKSFNAKASEGDCVPPCEFVPATVQPATLANTHGPVLNLPGWQTMLTSNGDLVGNTFRKGTFGQCAVEGIGGKPVNSKWCPSTLCTASNGLEVGLQEGCAQACLDDPSGTCVGYAHSSSYCILYSPTADQHIVHDNGDVWIADSRPTKPCVTLKNPEGCKTLNAAKPDPSYVCITLETGPGRWAAWGLDGASREDVGIKLTTSGAGADLYTEAVQQSLRRKVAAAGFVNSTPLDDSNVFLKVAEKDTLSSYEGSEVLLEFVVAANSTTASAMKKLIDAQLSTAPLANQQLNGILPEGARIVAVTPAGAGVWPLELSTEAWIGIVVGCVAAMVLGACCAWKCLQGKARDEAQQMHFAVAEDQEFQETGAPRFVLEELPSSKEAEMTSVRVVATADATIGKTMEKSSDDGRIPDRVEGD